MVQYRLVPSDQSADEPTVVLGESHRFQRASDLRFGPGPRGTITGLGWLVRQR